MTNSNKQIRLAQESAELSEEKNAALNAKQWELNGNANFDYDMLMGEAAMNSDKGLYMVMTAGNDGKVVLNNRYAQAMLNAGVPQAGGSSSADGLVKFMNAAVGSPKVASNWSEVLPMTEALSFVNTNGAKAPKAGEYISNPDASWYYASLEGFASKLGTAKLSNGQSNRNSTTVNDIENLNNTSWKSIVTSNQSVLYLGNYETSHYDYKNDVVSKVKGVIDALGQTVKSALPTVRAGAVDKAVKMTKEQYSDSAADINCDENYDKFIKGVKNSGNTCIVSGESRDSGTWHHSETFYAVDLKPLLQYFYNALVDELGDASDNGLCDTNDERQIYYEAQNENGKTAKEWNEAYKQLSSEAQKIVSAGNVKEVAAQYQQDVNTLANYKQIYDEACNGWIVDSSVSNRNVLTNKLENNQYVIKHDNKKSTMKSSSDFKQVKTNDKDEVEAYYKTQEKKIEVKEKKLQSEKDRLQVELSSVTSEAQSIQTLIQKNIERGFGYGYNA